MAASSSDKDRAAASSEDKDGERTLAYNDLSKEMNEKFASYPARATQYNFNPVRWLEFSEHTIREFISKSDDFSLSEALAFLGEKRQEIAVELGHGKEKRTTPQYGEPRSQLTAETLLANNPGFGDQETTIFQLIQEFVGNIEQFKSIENESYENENFSCKKKIKDDGSIEYSINVKRFKDIGSINKVWELYGCDIISVAPPIDSIKFSELEFKSKTAMVRCGDKLYYTPDTKNEKKCNEVYLGVNENVLRYFDFILQPTSTPRALSDKEQRAINDITPYPCQLYSNSLLKIEFIDFPSDRMRNKIIFNHQNPGGGLREGDILIAERYWEALKEWSFKDGVVVFLETLGKLVRELADLPNFTLGSSAVTEWLMRGIAFNKHLGLGSFNHEENRISWDFKAFCTFDENSYGRWFAEKAFKKIVRIPDEIAANGFIYNLPTSLAAEELKFPSSKQKDSKLGCPAGTTPMAFFKKVYLSQALFNTLLNKVVTGNTERVENILKPGGEEKREAVDVKLESSLLVALKGNIKNDNGKIILENISAFQYAVWAGDKNMWEVLLKYMSKEEASEQLKELESKGVVYKAYPQDSKGVVETRRESYFSLAPLINAYRQCLENYENKIWNDLQCIQWKNETFLELFVQLPVPILKEWKRALKIFGFEWGPKSVDALKKDLTSLTALQERIETNTATLKNEIMPGPQP